MALPALGEDTRPSELRRILFIFGGALLLRLAIALVLWPDSGHRSDLAILAQWANELARNGPMAFYRPGSGYFADYPPAYLYVLWVTGVAGSWLNGGNLAVAYPAFVLKLPYLLADLASAWFLLLLVRRVVGRRAGTWAAALFLFNPAVILVSTVWGQNDPVATAAVLAAAWLLATDRLEWATVAACVAMLIKFQYGFMVPIVVIVLLRRDVIGSPGRPPDRVRALRSLLVGALAVDLICLPFGLLPVAPGDPAHSLVARFVAANTAFPGVTQNAFNLWMNPVADIIRTGAGGLTEGHVVDDTAVLVGIGGIDLDAQWIGNILFVVAVLLAVRVLWVRDDALAVCFVALAVAVAFFDLPTRIHERYLYPAVAFAIPFLWVGRPAWRAVFAALSAILFLDVYWVYSLPIGNAGPGRGLLGPTVYSPAGIYLVALAADAVLLWLLWQARRPRTLPAGLDAAVLPVAAAGDPGSTAAGPATAGLVAAVPGGAGARPGARSASNPRGRILVARVERLLARVERGLARFRPGPRATVALFTALAVVAALVAARVGWIQGPWLWNPDMPKVDYPLASFFHDALASGRLPLWNDQLGLGFPLYAEGQIGAFYPPNWVIFQLPPLAALDLSRVLHLTLAGVGTGLIAFRFTRSRAAAAVAVVVAVLGGAIVTKLEWTNMVAAYGWMPWVLLPFAGRGAPTRRAFVAGGVLWGVQALAGHPNTWLLTGIAAVILILASAPRLRTIPGVIAFGLVGGAVGAVQLVPTAILTTLSVRSASLSNADLFASAATPFDVLGIGLANAFALPTASGWWDMYRVWYPDSTFALLEAGVYVGIPVFMLAAVALGLRRSRPLAVLAAASLVLPVVTAFQPSWWSALPLLNVLRSPVRAYMVTSLAVAVMAAVGVARIAVGSGEHQAPAAGGGRARRLRDPIGAAVAAAGVVVAAWAIVYWMATSAVDVFDAVYMFSSSFVDPKSLPDLRQTAIDALGRPFPRLAELAIGAAMLAAIATAGWRLAGRRTTRLALAALAVLPLFLFGAAPNSTAPLSAFDSGGSPFVQTAQAASAHRLLTLGEPGWYAGMPDQLAVAGVPDIRMFSSLNLAATESVTTALRAPGADPDLRRALGIDVIVTFNGAPCPGEVVATDADTKATFCRDAGALAPPYWIPSERVTPVAGSSASPIAPADWSIATTGLGSVAVPRAEVASFPGHLETRVDAPGAGWVWIDRAWWPAWDVTVDGQSVTVGRALGGLLVPVSAGSHTIVASLVPRDALLGLGIGVLGLLLAAMWVRLERPALPEDPGGSPTSSGPGA